MEDKKKLEIASSPKNDLLEMEKKKGIIDLLTEYLRRKFGYTFEVHEEELSDQGLPERCVLSVYDEKKEVYIDASKVIPQLPDWLKPFAKPVQYAWGNLLLLWWTPKLDKVYEGVTKDLAAMSPAPEASPAAAEEDEDAEP